MATMAMKRPGVDELECENARLANAHTRPLRLRSVKELKEAVAEAERSLREAAEYVTRLVAELRFMEHQRRTGVAGVVPSDAWRAEAHDIHAVRWPEAMRERQRARDRLRRARDNLKRVLEWEAAYPM